MNNITQTKTNVIKRDIKRRLNTINTGIKTAIGAAWDAGELLNELKGRMKQGEWLPYLKSIELGERQAQKYMRLASNLSKKEAIENKTISGALENLSKKLPKQEDAFKEEKKTNSKTVNDDKDEYYYFDVFAYNRFHNAMEGVANKLNRKIVKLESLDASGTVEYSEAVSELKITKELMSRMKEER